MIWRWLGLFVATLSLTWLALLWRFQNRSDIPEGVLWVYFAGLPLLLFALLAGFVWAFRRAYATSQKKQDTNAVEAGAASHTASEANSGAAQATVTPALTASVLFAGARNMAGAQAAEILDDLREGKLFPAPDAELLNWAGMPVVTARIAGLEAEFETLTPALAETGSEASLSDDIDAPAYVLRSAAVLQPLLHEAFAAVSQLPWADELTAVAKEEASTYHSALLRPLREQSARAVHMLAAVDEGWPAQSVQSFSHWLEQAVQMQSQQAACAVSFELVHGSAALWQAAQDFVRAKQAQQVSMGGAAVQPPLYLMLLASHSDLDEEWIAFYENKGVLFSAQDNPRGLVPGEAAAALLLEVGEQAGHGAQVSNDRQETRPLLYWPEVRHVTRAAKAKPVTMESGHIAPGDVPGVLVESMQAALQAAGVAAEDIACLCSDADRHSRQATELFGMTWAVLSRLDPLERIGMAGVSGGHMGAAASLLACVLAVEEVGQRQASCAFASVQDEQVRVAGCVTLPGLLPHA